uniref:Plastocyanin-like domain-containing protein n=1 Tax=Salix viminalis TaxID=40686 RepID=A0A6N2ND32_SALVM
MFNKAKDKVITQHIKAGQTYLLHLINVILNDEITNHVLIIFKVDVVLVNLFDAEIFFNVSGQIIYMAWVVLDGKLPDQNPLPTSADLPKCNIKGLYLPL